MVKVLLFIIIVFMKRDKEDWVILVLINFARALSLLSFCFHVLEFCIQSQTTSLTQCSDYIQVNQLGFVKQEDLADFGSPHQLVECFWEEC